MMPRNKQTRLLKENRKQDPIFPSPQQVPALMRNSLYSRKTLYFLIVLTAPLILPNFLDYFLSVIKSYIRFKYFLEGAFLRLSSHFSCWKTFVFFNRSSETFKANQFNNKKKKNCRLISNPDLCKSGWKENPLTSEQLNFVTLFAEAFVQ